MIHLRVVSNGNISQQHISDCVACVAVASGNRVKLVTADVGLILFVSAVKCADFDVVRPNNFREVVLPNEQVFAILPGRLMPKSFVTASPPDQTRICGTARMRENRREGCGDLIIECLSARIGSNEDVISGTRKLELVYST